MRMLINDEWETSRRQTKIKRNPKHPHYSVLWDSRRQEGNKCSFLQPRAPTTYLETAGDKGETSVGSCSTEHPKYPRRQLEASGRQAGHKCRIVRPKTSTILLQTRGGASWRQMGGKRRTMQLRASTAYWETLVDKWEASAEPCGLKHPESICRWETAGSQVGDRQAGLESAGSARQGVGKCGATWPRGPEHRQDIWKVQTKRPRSYSTLGNRGERVEMLVMLNREH